MAKGNAAIAVMFKRRGWYETRYQYRCEDGGTGTARAWHKEGTGLWIKSCQRERAFDVFAGTPANHAGETKPLYRITGFDHMADFKDRCRAASIAMQFAERIAPLADWANAGQWTVTKELGQRIHQIGLDVTGLTDAQLAEVDAARKVLPQRMLEAFLALARATSARITMPRRSTGMVKCSKQRGGWSGSTCPTLAVPSLRQSEDQIPREKTAAELLRAVVGSPMARQRTHCGFKREHRHTPEHMRQASCDAQSTMSVG
jgi:hypothetical protein